MYFKTKPNPAIKKLIKSHEQYEQWVVKSGLDTPPRRIEPGVELESIWARRRAAYMASMVAADLVKWLAKEYPDETISLDAWEYDMWYHNSPYNALHMFSQMFEQKNLRNRIMVGEWLTIQIKELDLGVPSVELWDIKVAPAYRGKGIGTKVIEALQDIVCGYLSGTLKLQLVPCAQDAPSYTDFMKRSISLRRYYEKLGFESQKSSGYMHW